MWASQVAKLCASIDQLTQTNPNNIISNFCTQSIEHEFPHELTRWKTQLSRITQHAVVHRHVCDGNARERAAHILHSMHPGVPFSLNDIRLADIRNLVVFELFKTCGVTVDTYFERYSSPPGTVAQNEAYSQIAHGHARAPSAEYTQRLWSIIMTIQVLKRFFHISDVIDKRCDIKSASRMLDSVGQLWLNHIRTFSLGDLVWQIFLDLFAFVSRESKPQDDR